MRYEHLLPFLFRVGFLKDVFENLRVQHERIEIAGRARLASGVVFFC